MEFTGPYRELLGRIYERCVRMGWFGPEIDAPRERTSRDVPDHIYCSLLSPEQIQKSLPFLEQYEYTYDLKRGTTTINSKHDRRLSHFGYPPATPAQLAQTEAAIGFPLPPLLHDIYTQLGNGGFGYWQGFVGVAGGSDSGELSPIDQGTIHASWKIADKVAEGLLKPNDSFICADLPDRFIPWTDFGCAMHGYIDGWSGGIYRISSYRLYEGISVDTDIPPQLTDYFRWLDDDTAEIEYVDTPDIDLFEGNWDEWGYEICYEAPSLEAWIETWLASPLPE